MKSTDLKIGMGLHHPRKQKQNKVSYIREQKDLYSLFTNNFERELQNCIYNSKPCTKFHGIFATILC